MLFTVVITASACSPGALSAYRFTQALIQKHHTVAQVFFYGDAVNIANANLTPAQDEPDIHRLWAKLIINHSIQTTVCIATALKRGVLDTQEQERYSKLSHCIAPPFELGGLGQLVEATANSDRAVSFS